MVLGGRVRAADTILWRPLELSLTGRSTLLRPVRAPSSGSLPLPNNPPLAGVLAGWRVAGRGRVAGWGGAECWGVGCWGLAERLAGWLAHGQRMTPLVKQPGTMTSSPSSSTLERREVSSEA